MYRLCVCFHINASIRPFLARGVVCQVLALPTLRVHVRKASHLGYFHIHFDTVIKMGKFIHIQYGF